MESEKYEDLKAFFDPLEFIQSSHKHQDIANIPYISPYLNEVKNIMPIVASDNSVKKGGQVCVGHIYGVYTKTELRDFFKSLEETFEDNKFIGRPIALRCSNSFHAVNILYDPSKPENERWKINDANNLLEKGRSFSEVADLSLGNVHLDKNIKIGFMNTQIFIAKDSEESKNSKRIKKNITDMTGRVQKWKKNQNIFV